MGLSRLLRALTARITLGRSFLWLERPSGSSDAWGKIADDFYADWNGMFRTLFLKPNATRIAAFQHTIEHRQTIIDRAIVGARHGADRGADSIVGEQSGPFVYYVRDSPAQGQDQPPVFVRRRQGEAVPQAPCANTGSSADIDGEQVVLDLPLVQASSEEKFVHLHAMQVSPDHSRLAYIVDLSGDEQYSLFVRSIDAADDPKPVFVDHATSVAWLNDSKAIMYTSVGCERPASSLLADTVYYRQDVRSPRNVLFQEKDPSFFVEMSRSRTGAHIFISSSSKTSSETWIVSSVGANGVQAGDTKEPRTGIPQAKLALKREPGVLYVVQDKNDNEFVLLTNRGGAHNFAVFTCSHSTLQSANEWVPFVAHRPNTIILDMDVFRTHLVLYCRDIPSMKPSVEVLPWNESAVTRSSASDAPFQIGKNTPSGKNHSPGRRRDGGLPTPGWRIPLAAVVPREYPISAVQASANMNFDASSITFSIGSPVGPDILCEHEFESTRPPRVLQKLEPRLLSPDVAASLGDVTSRLVYTQDGQHPPVPITLIESRKNRSASDILLHVYGAYGVSLDTRFRAEYLAFLEQGISLGFAHVRGGGELGPEWHRQGRASLKQNSIRDLFRVRNYLESRLGYRRFFGKATSAGGLALAAAINESPASFEKVILRVPFVDVTRASLDPAVPLSAHERDEWGHAKSGLHALSTIMDYCPSHNIFKLHKAASASVAGDHGSASDSASLTQIPQMLVTAAHNDKRVPDWMVASYIMRLTAELRDTPFRVQTRWILFTTDEMDVTHFGGDSDGGAREAAIELAFLLEQR
ncbi:Prolyl endopeptidase-like [Porphyridium purpureum]|uniref:Prolyl endopeptidase n=1 Tax=Porphyridium purpureum TaxID=35688 RepID=A0A5J4Z2U7_PORPP|nr:Prolyl endopeptidase-like [Porphyridium purpureum]|eukprot:POR7767..scf208_2